jgi:hypothetical protein
MQHRAFRQPGMNTQGYHYTLHPISLSLVLIRCDISAKILNCASGSLDLSFSYNHQAEAGLVGAILVPIARCIIEIYVLYISGLKFER